MSNKEILNNFFVLSTVPEEQEQKIYHFNLDNNRPIPIVFKNHKLLVYLFWKLKEIINRLYDIWVSKKTSKLINHIFVYRDYLHRIYQTLSGRCCTKNSILIEFSQLFVSVNIEDMKKCFAKPRIDITEEQFEQFEKDKLTFEETIKRLTPMREGFKTLLFNKK